MLLTVQRSDGRFAATNIPQTSTRIRLGTTSNRWIDRSARTTVTDCATAGGAAGAAVISGRSLQRRFRVAGLAGLPQREEGLVAGSPEGPDPLGPDAAVGAGPVL